MTEIRLRFRLIYTKYGSTIHLRFGASAQRETEDFTTGDFTIGRCFPLRNDYAEVSLGAIRHNIAVLRERQEESTKFLAVVKANGYGHGMEDVARTAIDCGAWGLAVAIVEEGIRMREAGFTCPVLVLGVPTVERIADYVAYDLSPAIFTPDMLRAFEAEAAGRNRTVSFHFAVDTGMSRIGFLEKRDFVTALDTLEDCPHMKFVGMFTHFAVAEIDDPSFTLLQATRFCSFATIARERGYSPILHACNSAASIRFPALQFDMVRYGIAMYGYHPAGHPVEGADLIPALTWKTEIVYVKEIPVGTSVSYGRRFTAERVTRVATLPVGYGDGYKRLLSNRADVLIRGHRCPVLGSVCMDQMMVDVTDVPDAQIGDTAVLLGRDGGEMISADELAELTGTISYEILLSISERVPRKVVD